MTSNGKPSDEVNDLLVDVVDAILELFLADDRRLAQPEINYAGIETGITTPDSVIHHLAGRAKLISLPDGRIAFALSLEPTSQEKPS